MSKNIKLSEIISLHEVDNMRSLLKNNGIFNATDEEIMATYDVYEGHGYYLFTTDLNSNVIFIEDTCDDGEDNIFETDIDNIVSYAYEMLSELVEEFYKENGIDIEDNKREEHRATVGARNLVYDLYSKVIDNKKDIIYTVMTETDDYPQDHSLDIDIKTFKTEVEAIKCMEDMVNYIFENESNFEDEVQLCSFYSDPLDLNNEVHQEILFLNLREEKEFCIISETEGMTRMKLEYHIDENKDNKKEETKMEFYCSIEKYQKYEVCDDHLDVQHFRSKEEGLKHFNWLVKEYKDKYLDEELGEFDELDEYENDELNFFSLYIDNVCNIEISLEKVVL